MFLSKLKKTKFSPSRFEISTLIQYIEEMKSDSILLENFTLICLGANPFCDMMDGISFSCELK